MPSLASVEVAPALPPPPPCPARYTHTHTHARRTITTPHHTAPTPTTHTPQHTHAPTHLLAELGARAAAVGHAALDELDRHRRQERALALGHVGGVPRAGALGAFGRRALLEQRDRDGAVGQRVPDLFFFVRRVGFRVGVV